MNRRQFLRATAVTAIAPAAATMPASAPADDPVAWHDVRDWGIEGRGFDDTERYFDRLPARAKGVVRDTVWTLSRHASGISVRFETDAPAIYVRLALTGAMLAMPHMPATGVSGLDLYARHEGDWRWLATYSPKAQAATALLAENIAPGGRAYVVNLPLYNSVGSLEIGVPRGAHFEPIPPRPQRPILFYGTSITQGACASRPGMSFANLLGRRLDRPILNFGFSGNGQTELEVGRFLAELDPAVYVIDCVANSSPEQIAERTGPLVRLIRGVRPATPILLLEDRTWANAPLRPDVAAMQQRKRQALREAHRAVVDAGIDGLHYRNAAGLIGEDGEGTVDGSHPNDVGMMRYADALEPEIARLL